MEWDQIKKKERQKRVLTPEEATMAAWTAEAMCLPQTQFKKPEYRASSMPICGHYLELMAGKTETVKGQSGFYTAVGTALHEFLQNRFPHTKNGAQVWGSWRCRNPRCNHLHVDMAWGDVQICHECGNADLAYVETEVVYRGLITMHIDLLILLPNGNFWLNDWKTCGTFVAENPDYVGLPYPKNVAQVEGYGVALWTEKRIRVEHVFLDYIVRGEPERDVEEPLNQPFGLKMTRERLARRKEQMDRIVEEKLAFERFKANRTRANLQAFDDLRPCHTRADYKNRYYGMASHFKYHEDKDCPFANEKGCFKSGFSEPAKLLAKKLKGGS